MLFICKTSVYNQRLFIKQFKEIIAWFLSASNIIFEWLQEQRTVKERLNKPSLWKRGLWEPFRIKTLVSREETKRNTGWMSRRKDEQTKQYVCKNVLTGAQSERGFHWNEGMGGDLEVCRVRLTERGQDKCGISTKKLRKTTAGRNLS